MKRLSIRTIFFSTLAFGLAGCLKEADMNTDPEQAGNMVEFANTGNNIASATSQYPGFYSDLGTVALGSSTTFNINVSYSGANNAPEDITVNLELDNELLTIYNTKNGTDYIIPPTAIYNMPTTAVIKKGTRLAQVKVTVTNNNDFDFDVNYGLPLKISSANKGTISANFGRAMYAFGFRNAYDGVYQVKGFAFRADPSSNLQGPVGPIERSLTSAGRFTTVWNGTIPWANGSGSALPGGYEPMFTVDDATNLVTISNPDGLLAPNPAYTNRYDPATKTFYISFTWGAGPSSRLHTDTLVFLRPR